MTITVDATKGWARPANASEWTELLAGTGIANPDHSWDCKDSSGDLNDGIGSLDLPAITSPTYNVSATGWAGTGVSGTDASSDGFRLGAGVGPDPDTTSQVWLVVFNLSGTPAANRAVFGIRSDNVNNSYRFLLLSSGGVRAGFNGGNVDNATSHPAGDYVVVMRYDRAASVAKVYTDLVTLTNTYHASNLIDAAKGLGSAGFPDEVVFMGAALWTGANAETLDDAAIATIRSRIQSPPVAGAKGHYYRRLLSMQECA